MKLLMNNWNYNDRYKKWHCNPSKFVLYFIFRSMKCASLTFEILDFKSIIIHKKIAFFSVYPLYILETVYYNIFIGIIACLLNTQLHIYKRHKRNFISFSSNLFLQISWKLKLTGDNMQNEWKKLIIAILKFLF